MTVHVLHSGFSKKLGNVPAIPDVVHHTFAAEHLHSTCKQLINISTGYDMELMLSHTNLPFDMCQQFARMPVLMHTSHCVYSSLPS